jgi:hypothetical protein
MDLIDVEDDFTYKQDLMEMLGGMEQLEEKQAKPLEKEEALIQEKQLDLEPLYKTGNIQHRILKTIQRTSNHGVILFYKNWVDNQIQGLPQHPYTKVSKDMGDICLGKKDHAFKGVYEKMDYTECYSLKKVFPRPM